VQARGMLTLELFVHCVFGWSVVISFRCAWKLSLWEKGKKCKRRVVNAC
jgi:hypothetical protein